MPTCLSGVHPHLHAALPRLTPALEQVARVATDDLDFAQSLTVDLRRVPAPPARKWQAMGYEDLCWADGRNSGARCEDKRP
jgi:hypothetical protein